MALTAQFRTCRLPFPAPLHPTPKPRARKTRRRLGTVSLSGTHPDSWGAGARPVVVGSVWLGATARAPPVRDARAFRARGRPSFKRNSTRALGGLVAFGPSGTEHRPLPPGARRDHPSGAAGTCQAGVCGDAAGPGGRPARAGLRIKRRRRATRRPPDRSGHSRGYALAMIHLDPAGPRAGRGLASQASGPRVRPPPTGTHRLPPARAPSAPAIRSGRKVGVVWHGWRGCGKRWGSSWGNEVLYFGN